MPAKIVADDNMNMEGVSFQFTPGDDEYVMEFQRTLVPSDEDLKHGFEKVNVTYFDMTVYNAIRGWELVDNSLIKMTLTQAAADELEVPVENPISCEDVDDIRPYYEKVREMLIATGELNG